jgi:hypothetical protein
MPLVRCIRADKATSEHQGKQTVFCVGSSRWQRGALGGSLWGVRECSSVLYREYVENKIAPFSCGEIRFRERIQIAPNCGFS